MNTKRGFMSQFLLAIALAITVGGGIYWYQVSKDSPDGKLISFGELIKPIINTTLKYSNPDLAFQTIVGQRLIPSPAENNTRGESFVAFGFNANPKSNVREAKITVTRNNAVPCLDNPLRKEINKNGLDVGYAASSGSNDEGWEKNYMRSIVKGNDMFCIEATIKGKNVISTNVETEDAKQLALDKGEIALFEQYLEQMTDEFKIIIY